MREWLSGGAPPCQGGGRGFDPRLALLFFAFFYMTGMEPARGFGLRSAPVGAKRAPLAPSAPSRASFLRRRQAKVPDSCLHEMKALFLGTGIGVFTPLRSALSACHWHAAPLAGSVYAPLRSAQSGRPLDVLRPISRFFFCVFLCGGDGTRSFFLFMQHFPKSII